MALQSRTITVGADRDSNNGGKNYVSGQVIYIKDEAGVLAPIFRDIDGLDPIAQNTISNVTNAKGQFTFFIEEGNYIAEYNDQSTALFVFGADYFNNQIDFVTAQVLAETQGVVDAFNQEGAEALAEFDLALDQYKESRGFNTKGTFAAGFTYELPNDVGLDASGNPWILIDTSSLPVTVTAGTTPTNPPYKQVAYGTAAQVSTNTSDTVQSFVDSFALKIFQSPTDWLTKIKTRTLLGGEVYEVRKVSDGTLATIYIDKEGDNEIAQDGTSNVSGSDGVVEFYINDGEYYIEVDLVKSYFNAMNYLKEIESLKQNSVTLEDFGVDATIDAAPVFIAAIEYLIDQSNTKNTLILGPRSYNFNSRALVNCLNQDINIIGHNDMSIINSSVIGESTIDLYNTQRSTFKGFYMKGNELDGLSGNGHALALRDTDPEGGTFLPQNCDIENLRFFGFRGDDLDVDGDPLKAAGLFLGGGKFNNVSRLLVDACGWGVVSQKSGQTLVGKSTFVNCDYFGVYMHEVRSGVAIDKSDFVYCGFGSGSTSSVIGGATIYHGGALFQNCSDTVTYRDNRAKTSVSGVSAVGCNLVNVEDNTLAADDITNGSSYVAYLSGNKKNNVNGNTFKLYNNINPLDVKTKSLYIGVSNNIGDSHTAIEGNDFQHVCNSISDIHIKGLGSSRAFCELKGNKFGNLTTTGLDVLTDDCILLEGVAFSGEISDNLFFVHENSNTCTISNTLRLDGASIDQDNILIDRNKERVYLGGTFSNPIKSTKGGGSSLFTTDASGNLSIDTGMIMSPNKLSITTRGATPVNVRVTGVSLGVISINVVNMDGTPYSSSNVTIYWTGEV